MKKTIDLFKLVFASLGGTISYFLGGMDFLLKALLLLIALDYLSGVIKSVYNQNLSSSVGLVGIAKKVFLLIIIALAFVIEEIVGAVFPLREMVITFFIANEGISILENACEIGVPVPSFLKNILEQLKKETEDED